MKESVGSLRVYFCLVGGLGLASALYGLSRQTPSPQTFATFALLCCFAVGFLYIGIRLERLLPAASGHIQLFLWVNAAFGTINWLAGVFVAPRGGPIVGVAVFSMVFMWAIAFYLVGNVKRLSAEAVVAAGEPAKAAGWHADPTGRHQLRHWDGATWTDHVCDAGRVGIDPVGVQDATSRQTAARPTSALHVFGRLAVIIGVAGAVFDLMVFGPVIIFMPLASGGSVSPAGALVLVVLPVALFAGVASLGAWMTRKSRLRDTVLAQMKPPVPRRTEAPG